MIPPLTVAAPPEPTPASAPPGGDRFAGSLARALNDRAPRPTPRTPERDTDVADAKAPAHREAVDGERPDDDAADDLGPDDLAGAAAMSAPASIATFGTVVAAAGALPLGRADGSSGPHGAPPAAPDATGVATDHDPAARPDAAATVVAPGATATPGIAPAAELPTGQIVTVDATQGQVATDEPPVAPNSPPGPATEPADQAPSATGDLPVASTAAAPAEPPASGPPERPAPAPQPAAGQAGTAAPTGPVAAAPAPREATGGIDPAGPAGVPGASAAADASEPGERTATVTADPTGQVGTGGLGLPTAPAGPATVTGGAPTAAATGAATLAATDTVRYLRELGPARAVQRLAVDLDGSMVAVRVDHTAPTPAVRVQVVDDPAGRLDGAWITSVERTLAQSMRRDGSGGEADPRRRDQAIPNPDDAAAPRSAGRRWADALGGTR
jgi:hypothetical protein